MVVFTVMEASSFEHLMTEVLRVVATMRSALGA